ncbi:hypothetical protein DFQ28_006734 [Apophysomyces sp. BC1034]|nr:hypothetical protein DFQ29_005555 [Apophysomyces sp. BC1021]KAG0187184.1 hypothetical protein DFQ28_006734 [Apophysomyces sp. BC1034]
MTLEESTKTASHLLAAVLKEKRVGESPHFHNPESLESFHTHYLEPSDLNSPHPHPHPQLDSCGVLLSLM